MKFNMSVAWRDATAMMAGNREVLLIVAGLFFFLPSLVLGFALGDAQELAMADPENAGAMMVTIYGRWWWLLTLIMIASIVGYLALLALLRDHSRPTVGEAMRIGLTGLLPAIGTYLVLTLGLGLVIGILLAIAAASGSVGVAVLIGTLAGILAIYVSVKVSLSGPIIAIDKVHNPIKVLARSWRLTKGNSVRLALFYVLLLIVYIVVATVLGMIVSALGLVIGASGGLIVNTVVSGLISAVISVVFVAVIAAAHRQLAGPSAEAVSETFE